MISVKAHVQNVGWTEEKFDGETAGTVGEGLRLEAIIIESDYNLEYQVHVENKGWMEWVKRGEIAGTVGESLRMEAFRIRLIGDTGGRSVWYRVHVQDYGWSSWTIDGAILGTVGLGIRMEAIEVKIVNPETDTDFSEWLDTFKKCKLGDVVLTVTTDESITMANEITSRPVEGGNITDHVLNNQLTLSFNGYILGKNADDDIAKIEKYQQTGTVLKYVGGNTVSSMIIESFDIKRDSSVGGGVAFSISLKQVYLVSDLVTVIDDKFVATQAYSLQKGGLQSVVFL